MLTWILVDSWHTPAMSMFHEKTIRTHTIRSKSYLLNDISCWIPMIENFFDWISTSSLSHNVNERVFLPHIFDSLKSFSHSIKSQVIQKLCHYSVLHARSKLFLLLVQFTHVSKLSVCCWEDNNFTNILSWWRMLLPGSQYKKHFLACVINTFLLLRFFIRPGQDQIKRFSEHFLSFSESDIR